MFEDVSQEAIQQANKLLDFLVKHSNPDWEKVFDTALDASELDLNTVNAIKALERYDLKAPVGAVVGGTGQAKDQAGLSGEDSQRAVRLLKQTGRLMQAGKGRGKALLVLSSAPIDTTDFAAPLGEQPTEEGPVESETSLDVSQLLKTANAAHRSLVKSHAQARSEIETQQETIRHLEDKIAQLDRRVSELTEELATKETLSHVTNWQ